MKSIGTIVAALAVLALSGCAPEAASDTRASVSSPAPYVVGSSGYGNRCTDCGTVESVSSREIAGKPNYAGAVVGAIIGGVAGHQFGSGRGQDAATAGGAVAGGVVGSQVGKEGTSTVYDLGVRMDSGDYRTVTVAATGGLRSGSRVRISGDRVEPM